MAIKTSKVGEKPNLRRNTYLRLGLLTYAPSQTKATATRALLSICYKYSRLSLSTLRLSQITAYLEEKIWFFFKHRNLTLGSKNVVDKGRTIFSMYISNKRSLITYSFVKFGCAICIFLNSGNLMSKYGYLEMFQRIPSTLR